MKSVIFVQASFLAIQMVAAENNCPRTYCENGMNPTTCDCYLTPLTRV